MRPRLDALPPAQQRLWPELRGIPAHFVLYGGTAITLLLGGRQSIDFDFFTTQPISAERVAREVEFLNGAELIQSEPNTVSFIVQRNGEIKVSFFGDLTFGRVGVPARFDDNGLYVASLLDLAAQKMKVILSRAEAKDYLDIHTLLRAGISLPQALGAAKALYPQFNPVLSIKALSYYGEPALAKVPPEVRQLLADEAANVRKISALHRVSEKLNPDT